MNGHLHSEPLHAHETKCDSDIDRFENEGGAGPASARYLGQTAGLPDDSTRSVRSVRDGRGGTIELDSLAMDGRGWWVDLDAIVGDDAPGARASPLIRRPDRTGGEYEVCFERCPSFADREPSDLPIQQSWCLVAVVPDTLSWEGMSGRRDPAED